MTPTRDTWLVLYRLEQVRGRPTDSTDGRTDATHKSLGLGFLRVVADPGIATGAYDTACSRQFDRVVLTTWILK